MLETPALIDVIEPSWCCMDVAALEGSKIAEKNRPRHRTLPPQRPRHQLLHLSETVAALEGSKMAENDRPRHRTLPPQQRPRQLVLHLSERQKGKV